LEQLVSIALLLCQFDCDREFYHRLVFIEMIAVSCELSLLERIELSDTCIAFSEEFEGIRERFDEICENVTGIREPSPRDQKYAFEPDCSVIQSMDTLYRVLRNLE